MMQIYFTEYTFNTLLLASFASDEPIEFTRLCKEWFGIILRTTDFGLLIPKIVNKYGDSGIDINLSIITGDSKFDFWKE